MPVQRSAISVSQLAELMGVDPARFIAIEKRGREWCVVTEEDDVQTSGTCPPLSDNTSKRKPKGGKR